MTSRIVITGGGTGGHVYPALAIADALDGLGELLYFGDPDRLEGRVVPERGYRLVALGTPMTPSNALGLPAFAARLARAVSQAIRLLHQHRPDLVIGVGGFGSVPVMLAALTLRLPVVLHEQNVRPGKANRLLTRLGVTIMGTFDGTERYVKPGRFVLTGCPVRSDIGTTDKAQARKQLSVPPEAQVCLVVGGSGGAAALNEVAFGLAQRLVGEPHLNVVHVTGRRYYEEVARRRAETVAPGVLARYDILAYADDISLYFAAADIVVSRSGSSTINEIMCSGRASVLVPSPNVTEDHQTANARYVESRGAAIVVTESVLASAPDQTLALMREPRTLEAMELAASNACTGSTARAKVRQHIAGHLGVAVPGQASGRQNTATST